VVDTAALPAMAPGDADAPLQRLIQYKLIEPDRRAGYRFQVELIGRCFAR
jgi:hypothetical protein